MGKSAALISYKKKKAFRFYFTVKHALDFLTAV